MKRLVIFLASIAFYFLLFANTSHAQIYTTDKLITVDIGSQTLYAWEGGQVINKSRVSTGMRYTPTVKGSFRIWHKNALQNMKGNYPPYEPYFFKKCSQCNVFPWGLRNSRRILA